MPAISTDTTSRTGDTQIRWFPWGVIVLVLPPLVFFLPRWAASPPKAPVPVLSKAIWEANALGTEGVYGLRFSDSGQYLLSSSGGDSWKGVELWNVPLGRRERAMPAPNAVISVAFSRLGGRKSIVAATHDFRAFHWLENETVASVHEFPRSDDFLRGLVPLDENSLAVLFAKHIGIVDPLWKVVQRLEAHTDWVRGIASFGEDALVSAGVDGRIVLWGRTNGVWKIHDSVRKDEHYYAVAVHEGSRTIAAYGSKIDLFRVDGRMTLTASIDPERSIHGLAFTSDGKFLLGAAQILNCGVGEVVVHEVGKPGFRKWFNAHTLPTYCIATGKNPDLFATGGADAKIRLWSLREVLASDSREADRQPCNCDNK